MLVGAAAVKYTPQCKQGWEETRWRVNYQKKMGSGHHNRQQGGKPVGLDSQSSLVVVN